MSRAAAILLILLCTAAAPAQKGPLGTRLDWQAARLLADGAAAADPRAPDAEIARVRAQFTALGRARSKLAAAVKQLPWADGGVVGDRLADPAVGKRVDAVLARARIVDISYASDGGVRLTAGVPLEALRLAIAPQEAPVVDADAPTAIVVDPGKLAIAPVLGLKVGAFRPPVVFTADPADPRAGSRPHKALATGLREGTLALDMDEKLLERAVKAGALILVVSP